MIDFSPCKINIGLEVISKREDGYHNLESIFYPVPLFDIIELVRQEAPEFTYTQSGIIVDSSLENNLLYKAWKLIQTQHLIGGLKVHLHKQVPMGAGLGGGSANAATLLKMMNKEFKLKLSNSRLLAYAAQLGSDCPFFINPKAAYAYETGTRLKPINLNLKGYHLLMIKPPVSISTQQAYAGISVAPSKYSLLLINKLPISQWKNKVFNSFEAPNFSIHPICKTIKKQIDDMGAIYTSMSGSGSTLYGIFDHPVDTSGIDGDYFVWQGILE